MSANGCARTSPFPSARRCANRWSPECRLRLLRLHGNRACALGAVAAGCRFFAGYPITPSSEIAEQLSRELPRVDGVFIQMEDEIGFARRRHRRFARRRQGDDRHQRTRLFADAGESRLRRDDRDAVRHRQRDARRPVDRHADAAGAGRHHAGAMGNPRRSPDHRRDAGFGAGNLYGDHPRLQSRRGVPHAGRSCSTTKSSRISSSRSRFPPDRRS